LKVLLITPPYHCGVLESAGSWLPTAFVYLAGSLRKAGYAVEIYDAMSKFHTYEDIRAHITQEQPDVIATGAITATIYDCIEVLKMILPQIIGKKLYIDFIFSALHEQLKKFDNKVRTEDRGQRTIYLQQ